VTAPGSLFLFNSFDQGTIGVWVHFWVFNFVPLIYLPVFVPIPYSFYDYCSVILLEVKDGDSPRISFIVEYRFCYPRFFVILNEFANCSFYLYKELSRNFDGDCIESVDCFWQNDYLYYISPANPWAWKIFLSSEIFLNFFLQRVEVLLYRPFTCLVKVTPRYFILFETIVKGVTMFIAALFIIVRSWKESRCPSTEEWIQKMWYIYTMEYYSAIKSNDFMKFIGKWMELENIILGEVTQSQKNTLGMHSLISGY